LGEIRRLRIDSWGSETSQITCWWLYFDDFCTKIDKHSGGMWAGKYPREVKHAHAFQWAFALC
jgi:hypothetical protein